MIILSTASKLAIAKMAWEGLEAWVGPDVSIEDTGKVSCVSELDGLTVDAAEFKVVAPSGRTSNGSFRHRVAAIIKIDDEATEQFALYADVFLPKELVRGETLPAAGKDRRWVVSSHGWKNDEGEARAGYRLSIQAAA